MDINIKINANKNIHENNEKDLDIVNQIMLQTF